MEEIPMDGDRRTATGDLRTVGRAIPHDSGHLHVSGGALYTDDIPEPRDLLHVAVGMSARAHATIERLDLAAVAAAPGVAAVITAADIAGENNYGPVVADDPIFAEDVVQYVGQPLFAVAAATVDQARKAAALARVEYGDLEPILDPDTAVRNESFVLPSVRLERGDARRAIGRAAHRLSGRTAVGGQDHFYLEGQIAMALPREDGDLYVYSSTQHPGEIQHAVAHAVGLEAKDVVVECRRMGGGFGGK